MTNKLSLKNIESFDSDYLINKMYDVGLKEDPDIKPYRNAYISVETLYPTSLTLTQNYVLISELEKVRRLYHRIRDFFGISILRLDGGLNVFYEDGSVVGIIPPVVEELVLDGRVYHLIADGQHRCYLSYQRHEPINVVMVRGVDKQYPYYAFPRRNQDWTSIELVNELPQGYIKKVYVTLNHKSLFRDYHSIFNNLSIGRGYFFEGKVGK